MLSLVRCLGIVLMSYGIFKCHIGCRFSLSGLFITLYMVCDNLPLHLLFMEKREREREREKEKASFHLFILYLMLVMFSLLFENTYSDTCSIL